ncbi:MAG: Isoquinoline 1-oxidoreductase subunit alpha [Fimbriimonadaceae bacterium]|nr:Isoquinoline 1-oxidoreductase subunit alpha [Fimbriimonadaceae bacterium]
MAKFKLNVNGQPHEIDVDPEMPLLWALRDHVAVKSPKYSCGVGMCAACTVLVDGEAIRSCVVPVSEIKDQKIVTLEGLSPDGSHPVQRAWMEEDVPQCGYCQAGHILSAVALLSKKPSPTDQDIDAQMGGNICRCGTYERMRRAIHRAAKEK